MKTHNIQGRTYVAIKQNETVAKFYNEDLGEIEGGTGTYYIGPAIKPDPRGYWISITDEIARVTPDGINQTPHYTTEDEAVEAAASELSKFEDIQNYHEYGVGDPLRTQFQRWLDNFCS